MGEDGARGKDWLRARGQNLLQTQFFSFFLDFDLHTRELESLELELYDLYFRSYFVHDLFF